MAVTLNNESTLSHWGGGAKMHLIGILYSPLIMLLLKHKHYLAHMEAS